MMTNRYTLIIYPMGTDFEKSIPIPPKTTIYTKTYCRVLSPEVSEGISSYIMMRCTWLKGLSENILTTIIQTIPDVACLSVDLTTNTYEQWFIDTDTNKLSLRPLVLNTESDTAYPDVILYNHNGYGGKGTGFTWAVTARNVFEPFIALNGLIIAFKNCYEIGCISSTEGYVRLYDRIFSHEELRCHLSHNFDACVPIKLRIIPYSKWLERAAHEAYIQCNLTKLTNRLAEWINQWHMLDWHSANNQIVLSCKDKLEDMDELLQQLSEFMRNVTDSVDVREEHIHYEITTQTEDVDDISIQKIIITLK